MFRNAVIGVIAAIASAAPAHAAIDIRLEEVGADVVASFSGSVDLTGAVPFGVGFAGPFIAPGGGGLNIFGGTTEVDFYELTSGEGFGSNVQTIGPTAFAGDALGVGQLPGQRLVFFETGYAGELIAGSLTFIGVTLAALGAEPGTYLYTLPNDTITLTVVDPVPLPAGGVLMATALAGGAALRRRARKSR